MSLSDLAIVSGEILSIGPTQLLAGQTGFSTTRLAGFSACSARGLPSQHESFVRAGLRLNVESLNPVSQKIGFTLHCR
jgi:hypothetical protein